MCGISECQRSKGYWQLRSDRALRMCMCQVTFFATRYTRFGAGVVGDDFMGADAVLWLGVVIVTTVVAVAGAVVAACAPSVGRL